MEEFSVTIKAMPMVDRPGFWSAEVTHISGAEVMVVDAHSMTDAFRMGCEALQDHFCDQVRKAR